MQINLTLLLILIANQINAQCWKPSYSRGIGKPLNACPANKEKSGALCYEKCKKGFYGISSVCWQTCTPGYQDYGVLCYRASFTYNKSCLNKSDINTCQPCLKDFRDNKITCERDSDYFFKSSYTRDTGQPLTCNEGEEKNGALCYSKCSNGYVGVGPACWLQCVYTGRPFDCGVLCVETVNQCAQFGTGISAAGLSLLSTLMVVPEDIQNSQYASIVTGLIAGGAGALGLASVAIFDACTFTNSTIYRQYS